MSKKSLIVLAISLLMASGIVAFVWAGCCDTDPLCNGTSGKVGGSECDYDFQVDLDQDCVSTTTVRLVLNDGYDTYYYMCQVMQEPPYDLCVPYAVRVGLDSEKIYSYHFDTTAGCSGRDPDSGENVVVMNCD